MGPEACGERAAAKKETQITLHERRKSQHAMGSHFEKIRNKNKQKSHDIKSGFRRESSKKNKEGKGGSSNENDGAQSAAKLLAFRNR